MHNDTKQNKQHKEKDNIRNIQQTAAHGGSSQLVVYLFASINIILILHGFSCIIFTLFLCIVLLCCIIYV